MGFAHFLVEFIPGYFTFFVVVVAIVNGVSLTFYQLTGYVCVYKS